MKDFCLGFTFVVAVAIQSVCFAQETPVIEFKNKTVVSGETTIRFPLRLNNLVKLWGKPDRTFAKVNTIYTWDNLGVVAFQETKDGPISALQFEFIPEKPDHSPKCGFRGELRILGKSFNSKSDEASLTSAGFKRPEALQSVLPYYLKAERDGVSFVASYESGLYSISAAPSQKKN